jgi:hypothetical protein
MKVLELFKGTGSICKSIKSIDNNIEVISLDIEKKYNPTHLCNILDFNYKQYPKDYFDIIWASPPCDKFSKLRNCWINRKLKNGTILTKEIIEEEIQTIGLPPLYKTQEIINYFKPKYYFIENPSTSKMKDYIDHNFLYDIDKYIVSYCKYSSENDVFDYRKNTTIWTNLKGFNPKICKNDCDSIITIDTDGSLHYGYNIPIKSKTRTLHKNPLGDSKKLKLIKNHYKKHKKDVSINYGGGTNRDERYRIPQKLLNELFNLCISEML